MWIGQYKFWCFCGLCTILMEPTVRQPSSNYLRSGCHLLALTHCMFHCVAEVHLTSGIKSGQLVNVKFWRPIKPHIPILTSEVEAEFISKGLSCTAVLTVADFIVCWLDLCSWSTHSSRMDISCSIKELLMTLTLPSVQWHACVPNYIISIPLE